MRSILLTFSLVIVVFTLHAQSLQSPEQFLGYKVGTKFTPHYKIVNYVRSLAQARPGMMKVEKYGETYEGRELLLAFIASPENLARLESIRQNNLRLAGLSAATSLADAPAIVWLSYNVHGNEPSSSEAALLTMYALLDPNNQQAKEYLKNTVVIVDPCLNPDGRDRYVHWYNSVSSKTPDANPQSREHAEPWPGGRTNHYNFDLNRDWAWQTQIETRQRLVKYNQWMPQVHVDFHEQSYNNPYYFAPAAEPFHEAITPWQREFQTTIGKNNAKYFDEQGWLYFTKESFDLFYPAYGDTYPTYSGAIGMTYEQGGHSRGGLSVLTNTGDTLTLVDRAQHHFTTSISTIEVASKNAGRLLSEFKKFFDDSKAGKGDANKTYVVTSDSYDKINNLARLLQLNGIETGTLRNTVFKGLNYNSNKEEAGTLKKFHLAVSSAQPRSVLAKILLGPSNTLVDSNTYDITAWSLPFAHGVDGFAVKDALAINPYTPAAAAPPVATSSYGYLIKYSSMAGAKMLAQLLKQGIKVRFTEQAISQKGKVYNRGSLIVLVKGNPADLASRLSKLASSIPVEIDPISTGFMEKGPDFGSPYIHFLQAPKVALITGDQASPGGAGEVWHLFEQDLDYPVSLINASGITNTNLRDFNVLIFPDGFYRTFSDKTTNDKLKEFVRGGGKIIAMESAGQQLAAADWDVKLKEDKTEEKGDYINLKKYENREREGLPNSIPGAIYRVELDASHPLAFGLGNTYYTLKQDATVYEFLKNGWNVGVFKKDNYLTGFAGNKVKAKLKDGLIFGVQEMGRGSVVLLADNPIFRAFWENGKLLFSNAIFMVGQ